MEKIQVTVHSKIPHVSQIVTGFLMLKEQGYPIEIIDDVGNSNSPLRELPVVTTNVCGGGYSCLRPVGWV